MGTFQRLRLLVSPMIDAVMFLALLGGGIAIVRLLWKWMREE